MLECSSFRQMERGKALLLSEKSSEFGLQDYAMVEDIRHFQAGERKILALYYYLVS
jgi:hypothetical protein